MIVLDNSLIVDALAGQRRSYAALQRAAETDEEFGVPALVLYEWLRGPRLPSELDALNRLILPESVIHFGPEEAKLAAELYRSVGRARARAFDLGIAACTILRNAPLWTLNPDDFRDIPGLRLYTLS